MKLRLLITGLLLSLSHAACAGQCDTYYGPFPCYNLTVIATVGGQVSSSPAGISCSGSTCSTTYNGGSVTLNASPLPGYTFHGWSGDCSGTGSCVASMTTDRTVTAGFAASAPPAVVPDTGFWYNPTEGGRGYVIEAHADNKLFIGGFMYDANGNAVWYASGPGAMSGSTYTGVWQQFGNGETLTGTYKPSTVVNASVGTITLQFLTSTSATLTLPDGRQISITRFPF